MMYVSQNSEPYDDHQEGPTLYEALVAPKAKVYLVYGGEYLIGVFSTPEGAAVHAKRCRGETTVRDVEVDFVAPEMKLFRFELMGNGDVRCIFQEAAPSDLRNAFDGNSQYRYIWAENMTAAIRKLEERHE